MPSWNIHVAHVEHLLSEHTAEELGIRDANAFLVGNLVPDVYVGYMVPGVSHLIDYKVTHLAGGGQIPLPDYQRFWETYIAGRANVSSLTLGAWAHLATDHVYNERVRTLLAQRGREIDEETRIAKQADFALFGETLPLAADPQANGELVRECARFPQYEIAEPDAQRTVAVARRIIAHNGCGNRLERPSYQLLPGEFLTSTFAEADRLIASGLELHAVESDQADDSDGACRLL